MTRLSTGTLTFLFLAGCFSANPQANVDDDAESDDAESDDAESGDTGPAATGAGPTDGPDSTTDTTEGSMGTTGPGDSGVETDESAGETDDSGAETGDSGTGTGTGDPGTETGAPDPDTGEPPASCGNGIIEEGEECDNGTVSPDNPNGNSDTGECLLNCQHNVCGDGLLYEGQEECDLGSPANGGTNGVRHSSCLVDCTLNVCGDEFVGEGEQCDRGDDNGLLVENGCSPTCQDIQTKRIVLAEFAPNADLLPDPVARLDALCPDGHRAMVGVDGARRATTAAWQSVDPLDWPIQPWTRYVNGGGAELWITDDVPLLGVRDGEQRTMGASIALFVVGCLPGQPCTQRHHITGLRPDWRNAASNCNDWSTSTSGSSAELRTSDFNEERDFLNGDRTTTCDIPGVGYMACVEQ